MKPSRLAPIMGTLAVVLLAFASFSYFMAGKPLYGFLLTLCTAGMIPACVVISWRNYRTQSRIYRAVRRLS